MLREGQAGEVWQTWNKEMSLCLHPFGLNDEFFIEILGFLCAQVGRVA